MDHAEGQVGCGERGGRELGQENFRPFSRGETTGGGPIVNGQGTGSREVLCEQGANLGVEIGKALADGGTVDAT